MRCATVLLASLAACLSSGCLVVSLQPAYEADSVAYDESLVGVWVNADDQTQATIERGEWRSYRVIYKDRFAARPLQGNLTRVGDETFLDLTEQRGADPGPYLVPVHGIVRIQLNGDTLLASVFDYTWFSRAIEQKTLHLAAAFDDRRNAVVTATTPEIRRWLARPPDDAVAAPMTFKRLR